MIPVMILAGGFARRLGALAKSMPKALMPIDGVPFITHQLDGLKKCGLTDIIVLVGHLGDQIQRELGNGADLGVRIRYVEDGPTPRDTGGAIRAALPIGVPQFFVLYGDVLIDFEPERFTTRLHESDALGVMGVTTTHQERHNVAYRKGRVMRYDNEHHAADLNAIDAGIHLFSASAFQYWPKGLTFPLALVFQRLIIEHRLAAVELAGPVHQIGTPDGLEAVRALTR